MTWEAPSLPGILPDDRFDELPTMVRKRIRTDQGPEGHWLWLGWIGNEGYGFLYLTRAQRTGRSDRALTHRFVFERLVGPIPTGLVIDHICEERLCCRPSHMEVVTLAENSSRIHYRDGEETEPWIPSSHRAPPWDGTGWEQPPLFDPSPFRGPKHYR